MSIQKYSYESVADCRAVFCIVHTGTAVDLWIHFILCSFRSRQQVDQTGSNVLVGAVFFIHDAVIYESCFKILCLSKIVADLKTKLYFVSADSICLVWFPGQHACFHCSLVSADLKIETFQHFIDCCFLFQQLIALPYQKI